jgi:hypothetical protein
MVKWVIWFNLKKEIYIYRVFYLKIDSVHYICLFQADAAAWDSHRSGCCSWSRPAWQPRLLVESPSSSVIAVSAWRLTASAMEKMIAGTSRTNPDTAPVSTVLDSPQIVRALDCFRCGLFALQIIYLFWALSVLRIINVMDYPSFVLYVFRFMRCENCLPWKLSVVYADYPFCGLQLSTDYTINMFVNHPFIRTYLMAIIQSFSSVIIRLSEHPWWRLYNHSVR